MLQAWQYSTILFFIVAAANHNVLALRGSKTRNDATAMATNSTEEQIVMDQVKELDSKEMDILALVQDMQNINHGRSTGMIFEQIHDGTCLDNASYAFNGPEFRLTCKDIGLSAEVIRESLCDLEEIYLNCPKGCGRCCSDNPSYLIYINILENDVRNCSWISEEEGRREEWCNTWNNGKLVSHECPVSCDSCKHHISLQPSMAPSTSMAPSNAPSVSSIPTSSPSDTPTMVPTSSSRPSSSPTSLPTNQPSMTIKPSMSPSKSSKPSGKPSPSPTESPTTEEKPNLIFIMTDEHNLRTLGCYRQYLSSIGNPGVVWGEKNYVYTPNIDKLADEGALFSNFYAVTPLCTPSRASFMSGLHPAFTGESLNNHGAMDGNVTTFASVLRDKGYFTSYLGKWHLSGEESPGWYDPGRDFGFTSTRYKYNRGHYKYFEDIEDRWKVQEYGIDAESKFIGSLDKHYATDFLFDRGIDDIQRALDANQTFAMVLSIPDPHSPNQVRPPYRTQFDDLKFEYPSSGKVAIKATPGSPKWNGVDHEGIDPNDAEAYIKEYEESAFYQNHMQQYYAMVALLDDNVGKLLSFLENKGIDENTIIVFSSDHGDLLGEHGRMNKGKPFETSAGVPFIIRYPKVIKDRKIIENAYSSVDFAPTILKLMGVDHPGVKFQGVDATPDLFKPTQTVEGDRITFTYDNERTSQWAAAVMNGYKLVVSLPDVPWLFHYTKDPDEQINYFEDPQYAHIVQKLQAALFDAMRDFAIPLAQTSDALFWDMPTCKDSGDAVTLLNGFKIMCTDIDDDEISTDRCLDQDEVINKCKFSCKSCTCTDSPGRMFVSGKLSICSELSSQCGNWRVKQFCPSTCNAC